MITKTTTIQGAIQLTMNGREVKEKIIMESDKMDHANEKRANEKPI